MLFSILYASTGKETCLVGPFQTEHYKSEECVIFCFRIITNDSECCPFQFKKLVKGLWP